MCVCVCVCGLGKPYVMGTKCPHKVGNIKSSQVKLSFIVIPLHVGTYSGTKCRASRVHGAT